MLDPVTIEVPAGPGWCRAWTDRVDEALRTWLAKSTRTEGLSVVALGSYARRQLCPASDIDLLLLHDGWPADDLAECVQQLCYPLWDAGLQVGHAVRTVAEAVRAAGQHLDSATALTDRRLVAGDPGPLDGLGDRVARWLRRRGGAVLAELAVADDERRRVAGQRPGVLQPDLKDGAGGLRDLDSLRWAAACVLGEPRLDRLVSAGYVGARDRRQLAAASDALLTARVALHLRSPRSGNVLRLDLQDEVSATLGIDADELLRRVGLSMRAVAHIRGRTWGRLLADARSGRRRRVSVQPAGAGLVLADGLVEVTADADTAEDATLPMRAVCAAARHGVHLGRGAAEQLERQARTTGPLAWDGVVRSAFVTTLAAGADAEPALTDADHLGIIQAYLPEWESVRGRPQRNPWHTFDLDTHGIRAVAALRRIAGGSIDADHQRLWAGLTDPTVCLLATFLHDVGKAFEVPGETGDHSVVGAEVAARWMRHMGFEPARADRVAALVRHHLLLPDIATRRDLDDPAEIEAVARRVGDVQALDMLYLLSLADSRATGPSAHSPWKDGLMATLHARARLALQGHDATPAPAIGPTPADPVTAGGAGSGELRALLAGLPPEYLRTASPARCAEHARLVMRLRQDSLLQASWGSGPVPGTGTVAVVAIDRQGLVADVAGVLAAHGMVVLEARAFTWNPPEGGPAIALDWFDVADPEGVDAERLVADLRATELGAYDVEGALRARELRRGRSRPPEGVALPSEVRIEPGADVWRVEVACPDGPGVLSRLSRVIADHGLEITGARIATLGPAASDVFFVRPPTEPIDGDELRRRLLEAATPAR